MSDINSGGDWDGKYTKEEEETNPAAATSSSFRNIPAASKHALESMERQPAIAILNNPFVQLSPFVAGGIACMFLIWSVENVGSTLLHKHILQSPNSLEACFKTL